MSSWWYDVMWTAVGAILAVFGLMLQLVRSAILTQDR